MIGRPVRSVFPLFCKICKKREDSDPPLAILSLLFLQIFFIGVFFIIKKFPQSKTAELCPFSLYTS
nr:MAG TPA: hypothetical protein [Caudoviricetes sp.]